MTTRANGPRDTRASSDDRPWLIWDGACGFCCRAVAWARRRGADRRFRIAAYQDAPDPPLDDRLRRDAKRALQVVFADGRTLSAGRAALYVMERVGCRRLARTLAHRPWIALVEAVYRFTARHRAGLSRVWSREPRLCRDEDAQRH